VNKAFISKLKSALQETLPGKEAHYKMATADRFENFMNPSGPYKKASVHLTLFEKDTVPHILFIKRAAVTKDKHSGQISFPGGQLDEVDKSLEECALRETHEELGLDLSRINLLGAMTPIYVYVSNFMVYPFIGIYDGLPEYTLQKSEVDYVIEVPIESFLSETIIMRKDINVRDVILKDVPYYNLNGETLWGATAMMTSEFVSIIKALH